MLNEGLIVNDTEALVKSAIVDQIRRLGPTTPDELERAVFKSITGHDREEVDWDVEDNQAGYFLWLKSFDQLVHQVSEDGYIQVEKLDDRGARRFVPTEHVPHADNRYHAKTI